MPRILVGLSFCLIDSLPDGKGPPERRTEQGPPKGGGVLLPGAKVNTVDEFWNSELFCVRKVTCCIHCRLAIPWWGLGKQTLIKYRDTSATKLIDICSKRIFKRRSSVSIDATVNSSCYFKSNLATILVWAKFQKKLLIFQNLQIRGWGTVMEL